MAGTAWGPERLGDQGLTSHQEESAHRAIHALLCDPVVRDQVDLVLTYRDGRHDRHSSTKAPSEGVYEAWATRGMVRFRRVLDDDGALSFEIIAEFGVNPIANQDPFALGTIEQECAAAEASGFESRDPSRRFIAPEHQSYPFSYERIAQLFDSPNAPDLAISTRDWTFGSVPGMHGALHVRQARAPLWFSGAGVVPGIYRSPARAVDIAPTALAALDFPLIDGRDASGRLSSERGVAPDVYLRRQDGHVLQELLDPSRSAPLYLHVFLLDGLHVTELDRLMTQEPDSFPHLGWLRERSAILASGSIVNYPSITWPSHTCIATGSWCGHHDVVNPSYYLRDTKQTVSPQGQQIDTEGFSSPDVESIYEAFKRVRGDECLTAAIFAPFGRGADHAVLEKRNLCDRAHYQEFRPELSLDEDPRWKEDGVEDAIQQSGLDTRGVAQLFDLFLRDDIRSPDMVYHELILTDGVGHEYGPHSDGLRSALAESDRRVGRVLDLLRQQGRLDQTLFVVTADHGMAPQDAALQANPARHLPKVGLSAVIADTMVWLLDLAIELERAPDRRTGRIFVFDNDAGPSGERLPIEGASVRITAPREGVEPELVATGRTGKGGVYGFSTPPELASEDLHASIRADGFNPRQLDLAGTSLSIDLVSALYGVAAEPGIRLRRRRRGPPSAAS